MVVEQRVSAIAERFALPPGALGLHWYEWDTLGYAEGSNYTKCETEITCECCPAPWHAHALMRVARSSA